jgi:hypothetical protein
MSDRGKEIDNGLLTQKCVGQAIQIVGQRGDILESYSYIMEDSAIMDSAWNAIVFSPNNA